MRLMIVAKILQHTTIHVEEEVLMEVYLEKVINISFD
jgi:hypothetical protein